MCPSSVLASNIIYKTHFKRERSAACLWICFCHKMTNLDPRPLVPWAAPEYENVLSGDVHPLIKSRTKGDPMQDDEVFLSCLSKAFPTPSLSLQILLLILQDAFLALIHLCLHISPLQREQTQYSFWERAMTRKGVPLATLVTAQSLPLHPGSPSHP